MTEQEMQENKIELFEFTPNQLRLLRSIQVHEYAKKGSIRYEVVAEDQIGIRKSIYHDGGLDMLEYLMNFDSSVLVAAEEAKQKLAQPEELQNQQQFPGVSF